MVYSDFMQRPAQNNAMNAGAARRPLSTAAIRCRVHGARCVLPPSGVEAGLTMVYFDFMKRPAPRRPATLSTYGTVCRIEFMFCV